MWDCGSEVAGLRKSADRPPLLTVIVPIFNEAATVQELIRQVVSTPQSKQVILVDDGSTDGTLALLQPWTALPYITLIRHSVNRGKGSAIRTALDHAIGRFTLVQDADLETDPRDYDALLEPLIAGTAQIVLGSRYLVTHQGIRQHWSIFRCGVILLNIACRLLYQIRVSDEACCYKISSTHLLKQMDLQCTRFEFCPEVIAKACRMRLTIREVPVRYYPRRVEDGKKLRFRDGIIALWTLWSWRHWDAPGGLGPSADLPSEPPEHTTA